MCPNTAVRLKKHFLIPVQIVGEKGKGGRSTKQNTDGKRFLTRGWGGEPVQFNLRLCHCGCTQRAQVMLCYAAHCKHYGSA